MRTHRGCRIVTTPHISQSDRDHLDDGLVLDSHPAHDDRETRVAQGNPSLPNQQQLLPLTEGLKS